MKILRRRRLKRLAQDLEPNLKRRFDPIGSLDGQLEEAARSYLREALYRGTNSRLWHVWREIQRELNRSAPELIGELPREGRRWFGVWALEHGEQEEGIASYLAFARDPGNFAVLTKENILLIRALVSRGQLASAIQFVDDLAEDGAEAPLEQSILSLALVDAGQPSTATARLAPARARYHDAGDVWAATAIALAAAGQDLEAKRAVVEAAKHGVFNETIRGHLLSSLVTASRWKELEAQSAYQPAEVAAQQDAWAANPGADLVPAPAGSPHLFGGDGWRMPACKGCGHPIRAWFTLNVAEIEPLRNELQGWRYVPLLGCVDCMVWMGRHDYAIDPVHKAVELESVAISTRKYGEAYVTTAPVPAQPAALAWREPFRAEGDVADPPPTPQVAGVPAWTQQAARVYCPSCRKEMVFVGSMATPVGFAPTIPINNESGYQYHFACRHCRRLSVIAQWT